MILNCLTFSQWASMGYARGAYACARGAATLQSFWKDTFGYYNLKSNTLRTEQSNGRMEEKAQSRIFVNRKICFSEFTRIWSRLLIPLQTPVATVQRKRGGVSSIENVASFTQENRWGQKGSCWCRDRETCWSCRINRFNGWASIFAAVYLVFL